MGKKEEGGGAGAGGGVPAGPDFCDDEGDVPGPECVSPQEQAAIVSFMQNGMGRRKIDRRSLAMARAALRFVALLLTAGVVKGYSDLNDLDEIGCTVAKEPKALQCPNPSQRRDVAEGAGNQSSVISGRVLARIEGKVDRVLERLESGTRQEVIVDESEARRVFALVKQLESGPKQWKAPLHMVFRLTVLEGRSQARVAKDCECVPALISRRVKTIESRFGMSIERLRSYASAIVEMEASVKGDRHRKRRAGAPADEAGQYDDGPARGDLVEDEHGCLPEEKPDYGA